MILTSIICIITIFIILFYFQCPTLYLRAICVIKLILSLITLLLIWLLEFILVDTCVCTFVPATSRFNCITLPIARPVHGASYPAIDRGKCLLCSEKELMCRSRRNKVGAFMESI